jgi:ribose-phosphate pyrophosphokinase
MVKLLIDKHEVKFETTIFPDGTSQIWKINLPDFLSPFDNNHIQILWMFENEGELMHVAQLAQLVQVTYDQPDIELVCPYLPYARQDKRISNTASFALYTFAEILYHLNITRVETFDAHSSVDTATLIYSYSPDNFHNSLLMQNGIQCYDMVCFPDKGAKERYVPSFIGMEKIFCEKIRNQLTGEITGLRVVNDYNYDITNKRILIVDDICDGGMTFIKVAEALKPYQPKQIDLAVSHGLFSKGKQVLHDAGITNIYTTNSLLRNPEGFKVW